MFINNKNKVNQLIVISLLLIFSVKISLAQCRVSVGYASFPLNLISDKKTVYTLNKDSTRGVTNTDIAKNNKPILKSNVRYIANSGDYDIRVYVKAGITDENIEKIYPGEARAYLANLYGIECRTIRSSKREHLAVLFDQFSNIVHNTPAASSNVATTIENHIFKPVKSQFLSKLEKSGRKTNPFKVVNNLFKRHFEYNTSAYSHKNSYLTMLASRLTDLPELNADYQAEHLILAKRHFKKWGFKKFSYVEATENKSINGYHVIADTQAYVTSTDNFILIVMRGSEFDSQHGLTATVADIITDASMFNPVYGGQLFGGNKMKLHPGFAHATAAILGKIKNHIDLLQNHNKDKPIFVTGHSLGGAISLLTGYNLFKSGYPVRAVYAHAAPRIGNMEFRNHYLNTRTNDFKVYRTIRERDIVPFFPPISRYYVNNPGELRLIKSPNESSRETSIQYIGKYNDEPKVTSIHPGIAHEAHNASRYVNDLYRAYKKYSSDKSMPFEYKK